MSITANNTAIDITTTSWKYWLTGFTDGEGCFSVSFNQRSALKTGIEVRPSFSISQSDKRIPIQNRQKILHVIKDYFNCGEIRVYHLTGIATYETRNLFDIATKILPHFDQYPLMTIKDKDFQSLKKISSMMRSGLHLNNQGLQTIIEMSYAMNPSGKRKLSKEVLLKLLR